MLLVELCFAVASALAPGSKVKSLPHCQWGIVLVCLLHIACTSLYHKLIEALAVVEDVSIHLNQDACEAVLRVILSRIAQPMLDAGQKSLMLQTAACGDFTTEVH